jgi:hypothetical protein
MKGFVVAHLRYCASCIAQGFYARAQQLSDHASLTTSRPGFMDFRTATLTYR